jgi:hypothetical protein
MTTISKPELDKCTIEELKEKIIQRIMFRYVLDKSIEDICDRDEIFEFISDNDVADAQEFLMVDLMRDLGLMADLLDQKGYTHKASKEEIDKIRDSILLLGETGIRDLIERRSWAA